MSGLSTEAVSGNVLPDKSPPLVEAILPDGRLRAIQVNFCKSPVCANYGVPASLKKYARRASVDAGLGTEYRLVASGKAQPSLSCLLCNESLPIKSNQGIAEELDRIACYLVPPSGVCCRSVGCVHANTPAPNDAAYQRFGLSERGSQRYRCRECQKTFSVPASPILRQRVPHKNREILRLLMNKVPLARICEVADVSMQTVYDKLDFFHKQALLFIGKHERVLLKTFKRDRLYIAVDRQAYVVNWSEREDKRNVVLNALGSADLDTGYVFGMHRNFDSGISAEDTSFAAQACGDFDISPPYRRFARLWLEPDYAAATATTAKRIASKKEYSLASGIQATYRDADQREDVESHERITSEVKFPDFGMQVRSEYTLYSHFFLLRELCRGVEKVRFYLDQEPGIRAACLSAFEAEVKAGCCEAFYVRLEKEVTVDEKRKLIGRSREAFKEAQVANPGKSEREVQLLLMRAEIDRAAAYGRWKDRWLDHPFPNNSEPKKALCCLTDAMRYEDDLDHLANLYLKGSLHAIDRFFMQVRRRLSFLERPISTASKFGRTWHGYSAYKPENIEKLLMVFRVYYNYCLVGGDGKTPAMRLGLASHAVELDELLGVD